jgi:hypothetical protein
MRRQSYKSILGGTFGAKAITLAEHDSFLDWLVSQTTGDASADELYRTVSWVFWCVYKRAYAIGQMPYAIYPLGAEDGDSDSEIKDFIDLRRTLFEVEAWLALEAQAFVLKRLPDKLQTLNKYTMAVAAYDEDGPTLFEQRIKGQLNRFKPEELLYFRTWHPRDDINAGVAGSAPAKEPGQVIKNTNEWADSFFKNGAIPAVLLTTEGSPPPKERDRIESKWNEMLKGVRNAFRTMVLGHGLTPTVIGQPVDDLAMPDLSKDKKEQILGSFLLPPGLAEPKTNSAEHDAQKLEAYESCYIPEWNTWIEPVFNEQLLNPLGLRLSGRPQELEIFQAKESLKAESAAFFVGGMMIPLYKENLVAVDEVRRVANTILTAASLPELDEEFEPEERTPPQLQPFAGEREGETEEGITPIEERIESRTGKALDNELKRWERKAVSRIKEGHPLKALQFASDVIPAVMHRMIVHSLEQATTLGDVLETFKAARGEKQVQFIPEGAGDPRFQGAARGRSHSQRKLRCRVPGFGMIARSGIGIPNRADTSRIEQRSNCATGTPRARLPMLTSCLGSSSTNKSTCKSGSLRCAGRSRTPTSINICLGAAVKTI